jgi:hypothetical protein
LAFEDHRVWDLIRWRTAHEVWNGQFNDPVAHVHVLFPYRIIRPGHPNHNKYVFDARPFCGQSTGAAWRAAGEAVLRAVDGGRLAGGGRGRLANRRGGRDVPRWLRS